jgi:hypothetical protein
MGLRPKLPYWFVPPVLTPGRVWFAMSVAVITDAIQVMLGPFGAFLVVQVLDVIAMLLIVRAIGFHPLLLPTFVAELFPIIEFLPTWTGCTAAVLMVRKWRSPTAPSDGQTIDVEVVASPAPKSPPPLPPKSPPPA